MNRGVSRGAWYVAGALLMALLPVPACLSATQQRESSLVRVARTFNDDWRWGRWEAVASVMPPDEARLFRERAASLEDELELADFEVTAIDFGADSKTATVVATFEWYWKSDPRVRKTTVTERWSAEQGAWQMIEVRRTRGERFGLVPEPATPPAPDSAPTEPAVPPDM